MSRRRSAARNGPWWNSRYRRILLNGGGAPAAPGGTYTMTVSGAGPNYGDQTGATITPVPAFMPGTDAWTQLLVANTDVLTMTVSGLETNYSHLLINFPGFDSNWYKLRADPSSVYTTWVGNIAGLHAYLASEVGKDIQYNVDFVGGTGNEIDLDPYYHWLIPEQTGSTYRGFDASVNPGTYDPGYLSSMEFEDTNNTFMEEFKVRNTGLFTIDTPASPSPTGAITVEIEGYNEGAPFVTDAWNTFDFRATGKTDLYTYFGTVLGTPLWVKITGPV